MPKPITIREVAADAGVGTATVSRVLNEPWRVNPQTIERVKQSIQKLGYKPNFRARLLAHGNSGMICFLLSNRPFAHAVHGQVLQGAAEQAELIGIQIVYACCTYDADTQPSDIRLPQLLAARGLIDGVILAGTNYANIVEAMEQLELPYVVFGTNLINDDKPAPRSAVYVDEQEGSRRATEHLLALGHRQIVFIGDTSLPWYRRRYQGYCDAMREANLLPLPPVGKDGADAVRMGERSARELLCRGDEFTALVAGSDRAAHGAIGALREYGLKVPEQISIVGFDDDEIASLEEPPLTTVRVPADQVGAKCVQILNEAIRLGRSTQEKVCLPVELVVRQSTSIPKTQTINALYTDERSRI
ncbi:MAG: LacI family DNA-binding transcriptional regulator [Armatimonadota bacterium]|nr:LacI family DNA-binding transcriptional regulator [Armatimonadota bacterium]